MVAQAQQIIEAQTYAREAAAAQSAALVAAAVESFLGWYDPAAVTKWADDLAKQQESVLLNLARTTDAYTAQLSSVITGKRARPAGAIDVSDLRTGVTHAGAYARAADVYRYQQSRWDSFARQLAKPSLADQWDQVTSDLKRKAPELPAASAADQFEAFTKKANAEAAARAEEARQAAQAEADAQLSPPTIQSPEDAAQDRAGSVADMDTQLVVQQQSQKSYAAQKNVIGFRRVLHPEISRTGTCGLCVAASTRLYHITDLLPIHARCACTTAPVYEAADIGDVLNQTDLAQVYGDAAAHPNAERAHAGSTTYGRDLKRVRYQVDDHGELGPLLNPEGAKVRTPADVKRDEQGNRRPLTEAEKRQRLQHIRNDLANALPRARSLATSDPTKWDAYAKSLQKRLADLDQQLS